MSCIRIVFVDVVQYDSISRCAQPRPPVPDHGFVLFAETLMRLPWDNWDSYEVGLLEHPIVTKTAINVGIYLIGDWLSQVQHLVRCCIDFFLTFCAPAVEGLSTEGGKRYINTVSYQLIVVLFYY